jgi:hypothetical protein
LEWSTIIENGTSRKFQSANGRIGGRYLQVEHEAGTLQDILKYQGATNPLLVANEHQLVFFEAHFADIKFGGQGGNAIQWWPNGQMGKENSWKFPIQQLGPPHFPPMFGPTLDYKWTTLQIWCPFITAKMEIL